MDPAHPPGGVHARTMSRVTGRPTSVRREGLRFAIPGVGALVVVVAASLWPAAGRTEMRVATPKRSPASMS